MSIHHEYGKLLDRHSDPILLYYCLGDAREKIRHHERHRRESRRFCEHGLEGAEQQTGHQQGDTRKDIEDRKGTGLHKERDRFGIAQPPDEDRRCHTRRHHESVLRRSDERYRSSGEEAKLSVAAHEHWDRSEKAERGHTDASGKKGRRHRDNPLRKRFERSGKTGLDQRARRHRWKAF